MREFIREVCRRNEAISDVNNFVFEKMNEIVSQICVGSFFSGVRCSSRSIERNKSLPFEPASVINLEY
jgi:hypothetical protein